MKFLLKTVAVLTSLLVVLIAALAIYLFATALQPSRPVGFQRVIAADAGHRPIGVDVWYPTEARPGFVLVGASGQRIAADAAVTGQDLPLVVISHGTGGGPMSHADTALALAAAGFVVAAPAHTGDNFQDDGLVGTSQWMVDRSRHIGRVTDFMLTSWKDRSHLDRRRVGIFGFSAGATTALIVAGGVPDLGRMASECASHPEFVCQLSKPGAAMVNPAPTAWTRDPRVGAVVIAAPGLGFTFEPSGLSAVHAPVQLWVGAEDHAVPYATNSGVVRRLLPDPPEFHAVPGAQHTSFLAPCGLIGAPGLCKDKPGFDRAAFHRDFNRSVTAFFKARLAEPH